jgi:hypothetical protein
LNGGDAAMPPESRAFSAVSQRSGLVAMSNPSARTLGGSM